MGRGRSVVALTLHQPWAALIVVGAKRFETRGWDTEYRGPLAIHAGKTLVKPAETSEALEARCVEVFGAQWRDQMVLGAMLGLAVLVDIHPVEEVADELTPEEMVAGNYEPGRFAWRLDKARALRTPVEHRGYQKLWTWDGVPPTLDYAPVGSLR